MTIKYIEELDDINVHFVISDYDTKLALVKLKEYGVNISSLLRAYLREQGDKYDKTFR